MYVQQDFKSTFIALKNEYCYIGAVIDQQSVLKHVISKVNFSKGTGICIVPKNLNLSKKIC